MLVLLEEAFFVGRHSMYRESSHLLMEEILRKKICTEEEDLEVAQAPFLGLSPREAAPQKIRGGRHSQRSFESAEHPRSSWSMVLTRLLRVRRPDPEKSGSAWRGYACGGCG